VSVEERVEHTTRRSRHSSGRGGCGYGNAKGYARHFTLSLPFSSLLPNGPHTPSHLPIFFLLPQPFTHAQSVTRRNTFFQLHVK